MRTVHAAGAALALAMLASCAPRPAPPEPVPQPRADPPRPRPQPQVPPPAPLDWRDAALAPGDWSYRSEGGASSAAYGPPGAPAFVVRCEPSRQISLARIGAGGGTVLNIRTTGSARSLPAARRQSALVASVAVSDPLLDEMAFSRGRFAVEVPGQPLLIGPAWPEVARLIEDCRG